MNPGARPLLSPSARSWGEGDLSSPAQAPRSGRPLCPGSPSSCGASRPGGAEGSPALVPKAPQAPAPCPPCSQGRQVPGGWGTEDAVRALSRTAGEPPCQKGRFRASAGTFASRSGDAPESPGFPDLGTGTQPPFPQSPRIFSGSLSFSTCIGSVMGSLFHFKWNKVVRKFLSSHPTSAPLQLLHIGDSNCVMWGGGLDSM